jgi:hypothetical protein
MYKHYRKTLYIIEIMEPRLNKRTGIANRNRNMYTLILYKSISSQVSIATPPITTGLVLQIDAKFGSYNDGQTVSTMPDYSGTVSAGTCTAVTWSANGLSTGNPGFQFNGTSSYINYGNVNNLGTKSTAFFCVYKKTTDKSMCLLAKSLYGGADYRYVYHLEDGAGTLPFTFYSIIGSNFTTTAGSLDPITTPLVTSFTWDRSGPSRLTVNNVTTTGSLTHSQSFSSSMNLLVGVYPDGSGLAPHSSYHLNGVISELLLYHVTTPFTTQQTADITTYLKTKWGVA